MLEEQATEWGDPNLQTLEHLAESNSARAGMATKSSVAMERRVGIPKVLSWYFSSGPGKTRGDRVWSLHFFQVRQDWSTL